VIDLFLFLFFVFLFFGITIMGTVMMAYEPW
jgi:hypothetical protein